MTPIAGSRRLALYTNFNADPAALAAEHAAGDRSEPVPYGLQRLHEHGYRLALPGALDHRAQRLANAAGRRIDGLPWGWGLRGSPPPGTTTVCWDERSSVPLSIVAGRRPISGVIWIPDRRATAVQRHALRRLRGAWALGEPQAARLAAEGVAGGDVEYLEFGVSDAFFTPDGSAPRARHVVCVGNDVHRDYTLLVEALVDLRARHGVQAELTLVTRDAVDVPDWLGRRLSHLTERALRDLYRSAAAVVVPCRPNEHVSGMTSALESLACGRPVIATRTPGMDRYVRDGATGILVAPGDREALTLALRELLSDQERGDALGRAGRTDVERRLSTVHLAARLAALLRRHDA